MLDNKKLKELITKFVRDNYGHSEAREPSWDIESLANFIVKSFPRPPSPTSSVTPVTDNSVPFNGTKSLKQEVQEEILTLLDESLEREISLSDGFLTVAEMARETIYDFRKDK